MTVNLSKSLSFSDFCLFFASMEMAEAAPNRTFRYIFHFNYFFGSFFSWDSSRIARNGNKKWLLPNNRLVGVFAENCRRGLKSQASVAVLLSVKCHPRSSTIDDSWSFRQMAQEVRRNWLLEMGSERVFDEASRPNKTKRWRFMSV